MRSDQSTSPEIEVLPNRYEFKSAIEALTGDSAKPVSEERLRAKIIADHPTAGLSEEPEQAVQISEAVEKGLINHGAEDGTVRLGDSAGTSVSETRIR